MKFLITENQSLYLRRRLVQIEDYLNQALVYVDKSDYNFNDYYEEIIWQVIDRLKDETTKGHMTETYKYVAEKYYKKIRKYYYDNID